MLGENSIQARLGGGRLMPTIEQFNPGLTNSGDQIAEQVDIGNMRTCDDFGIVTLEIFASSDSGIHQTLNLTHGGK